MLSTTQVWWEGIRIRQQTWQISYDKNTGVGSYVFLCPSTDFHDERNHSITWYTFFTSDGIRLHFPATTTGDMDKTLQKWLTGAVDHDGLKKKREEKQRNQNRGYKDRVVESQRFAPYYRLFIHVLMFLNACSLKKHLLELQISFLHLPGSNIYIFVRNKKFVK